MEKQRWEQSEKRKAEERRSEKRKSEKKEDAGARKGGKVAKHGVFPMIWGSGGSKSRLAKAAGAEPCGHMSDEKLHAVVARSTFPSQNAQSTSTSDHFWKLWHRTSARRCGAKHISKSKCTKHTSVSDHFWKLPCRKSARRCGPKHISKSTVLKTDGLGALLEVDLSKKCMLLWRTCSKVSKTWFFCSIFNYNHHYTPLQSTTLHYTTTTTTATATVTTTLHYTTLR